MIPRAGAGPVDGQSRAVRATRSGMRPGDRPVIGADLGGTWLRLVVLGAGRAPRRLRLRSTGLRGLGKTLRSTWKRVGGRRRPAALVVAARGVWTAAERRALGRALGRLASRVVVLSDAQAALLGALGDRPGLLILAGTGSIVIGRDRRGRWARAGGLGPLLGDEGSAFWVGREWLRQTTRGEDFLPVRRLVGSPDPVAAIAALAPRVIGRARRGDRRARAIAAAAQRHLAVLAVEVRHRLGLPAPVAVSWAGGLLEDAWFRAGLRRAVARAGLPARWHPPAAAPVEAAAALATRLAGHRRAGGGRR